MSFELLPGNGISRRAFVLMPIALGGMMALWRRPERSLPNVTDQGTGPMIALMNFRVSGESAGVVKVRKLEKTDSEWRRELTADEYTMTRQQGTEFAFSNAYWKVHEPGIYRCVGCGNALFRSQDKFDSGTGWPSFTSPMAAQNIYMRRDDGFGLDRTEVLCRKCDAHLGHVFPDGPTPGGQRYCLNSAALRLVRYAQAS